MNKPNNNLTFLSYKFSGVDFDELQTILPQIELALQELWLDVFCSIYLEPMLREQKMTYDEILDFCLKKQEDASIFFAFINHEQESHGMSQELANAIKLQQKIVLWIRRWLDYGLFRQAALQRVIEFDTVDELCALLSNNGLPE